MSYFKRSAHSTVRFAVPKCECYACGDSGIVTNGDGLLSAFVKGYDVDENGIHHGGSDLGMICHCHAAFDVKDEKDHVIRYGFRDSINSRIREVANDQGQFQAVGVSCPKEVVNEIHKLRKVKWDQTARVMLEKRQQAAKGENPEPTLFMKEARAALKPDGFVQSQVFSSVGDTMSSMFNAIESGTEAGLDRPDPHRTLGQQVEISKPRDFVPPAPDFDF